MTKEWLRDTWGIAPSMDDDTRLDFGAKVPVYLLTDDPGEWGGANRDWEAHRKAAARKVFGRMVADLWGRRQVLLEDRVLPSLFEEAARRKQKELLARVDPLEFQAELDRLDARVAEIDKATWPLIARSVDPFVGPGYDAATDLPIRDGFRDGTAEQRSRLAELAKALGDTAPAGAIDPTSAARRPRRCSSRWPTCFSSWRADTVRSNPCWRPIAAGRSRTARTSSSTTCPLTGNRGSPGSSGTSGSTPRRSRRGPAPTATRKRGWRVR